MLFHLCVVDRRMSFALGCQARERLSDVKTGRKQEIYRADGCQLASVRACRSSYDRMSEMGAGEAASSERLRFLRYLPLRRIGHRVQHRPPGRWRLYPDRSLRRDHLDGGLARRAIAPARLPFGRNRLVARRSSVAHPEPVEVRGLPAVREAGADHSAASLASVETTMPSRSSAVISASSRPSSARMARLCSPTRGGWRRRPRSWESISIGRRGSLVILPFGNVVCSIRPWALSCGSSNRSLVRATGAKGMPMSSQIRTM